MKSKRIVRHITMNVAKAYQADERKVAKVWAGKHIIRRRRR